MRTFSESPKPSAPATRIKAQRSRLVGIDRFFFDWRGGRTPAGEPYGEPVFDHLRKALEGRSRPLTHAYWCDAAPCSMLIDEVEDIWSAIADSDDWSRFDAKIEAVRRMRAAMTSDGPA